MADTLLDFGSKLSKLADALDGTSLKTINGRVALLAKNDALSALDSDLSGRKFTNWKPKLSVGYELTEGGATVGGRPAGPWVVLNQGRKRGRKRSRKAKRVIGWGPTKGKHTWDKAKTKIAAETPKRYDAEVVRVLKELF